MRGSRAALVLFGVAAFLAVAGAGAAKEPAKAPFLGLVSTGQESWKLVRLNPLTLGQRPGRSVPVGSPAGWSFSPDRAKLVLADYGIAATLVLVDTGTMRRLGIVDTGGNALISVTFWPQEQRLYAVVTRLTRKEDGTYARQPPALVAVDPTTRAVVDLRTLALSYHGIVRGHRRLQKGSPEGSLRTVRWVQGGVLVVSGRDDHSSVDAEGRVVYQPRPVGVELVSTRDWSAKMVDATGEGVSIGADAMLVTPWTWDSSRQRYLGNGATIYGLDGVKRAHVLGQRQVHGT